MSISRSTQRLRIAIDVEDAELADRIVAALSDASGVELVTGTEVADVVVRQAGPPVPPDIESDPSLTARELEVLALLAEGASNKEIARRLGITPHTAKFHVGRLLDKLDAVSRTDAVAHALRLGVIEM